MRWTVTIAYRTAAGALREEAFDVDRDTISEAEEAAVREVLRQPGREIVGVEIDRAE